jgi:peroxiredoxin
VKRFLSIFASAVAIVSIGACAASEVQIAASKEPLDLTLSRANGTTVELAALSGRPTLLFLFATYDTDSQFALGPLVQFLESEPRLQVIGVALQPDAKSFLDMYQSSLGVPFALFYDPGNRLLRGQTALGRVAAVPTFVALDAEGHVRAQHLGVASADQLRELADSALK